MFFCSSRFYCSCPKKKQNELATWGFKNIIMLFLLHYCFNIVEWLLMGGVQSCWLQHTFTEKGIFGMDLWRVLYLECKLNFQSFSLSFKPYLRPFGRTDDPCHPIITIHNPILLCPSNKIILMDSVSSSKIEAGLFYHLLSIN